jgi:hypothetical protein
VPSRHKSPLTFSQPVPGDKRPTAVSGGSGPLCRDGQVFISNTLATAVAEYSFYFGIPGDTPFAGDFDGDGVNSVGLYRTTSGLAYFRNDLTTGEADTEVDFGSDGWVAAGRAAPGVIFDVAVLPGESIQAGAAVPTGRTSL